MVEKTCDPAGDTQLHQVLHMNGGDGDNSYANNSLLQKKVLLQAKPTLQRAAASLYVNNSFPECITVADMGCSSGPNTFIPIWEIIEALEDASNRSNKNPPTLQFFLNDLPGNDFNAIFKSLPGFYDQLREQKGVGFGSGFVAAMPGNFYGRLFPPKSLHLVHSSYSLHWFSEEPKIPLNKGNIYIAKTSPTGVHNAYLDQFRRDFTSFLRSRSEEVIPGGCMVLTIYGRDDNTDPSSEEYRYTIWELFGIMLNDMVQEGLIEESKLDSFNVPFYGASAEEVENVVKLEGSFEINRFESFHVGWDASIEDCHKDSMDKHTKGKHVANRMRAIMESVLGSHFGERMVGFMFQRFSIVIGDYLEKCNGQYTNHLVSLQRQ